MGLDRFTGSGTAAWAPKPLGRKHEGCEGEAQGWRAIFQTTPFGVGCISRQPGQTGQTLPPTAPLWLLEGRI